MSRAPPPSQTFRPSLVRLALDILMSIVAVLRGRWERELVRPFLHPDHRTRITRAKFLAMMEVMFRDDARLRREIFEAAMRMLGRDIPDLPDSAFAMPRPKSARGLWRRWGDYARMIAAPKWYAWRLARRLARMGCDERQFDQSTPRSTCRLIAADVRSALAPTFSHDPAALAVMHARAPPSAVINSSAPCKLPLARSLAHV